MRAIGGIHSDALSLCKNNEHNAWAGLCNLSTNYALKTSYPQVIQL